MCDNLFGLPDVPAPAEPEPQPQPPLTGDQSEMFEAWEKLGLTSLFEQSTGKGDSHATSSTK